MSTPTTLAKDASQVGALCTSCEDGAVERLRTCVQCREAVVVCDECSWLSYQIEYPKKSGIWYDFCADCYEENQHHVRAEEDRA